MAINKFNKSNEEKLAKVGFNSLSNERSENLRMYLSARKHFRNRRMKIVEKKWRKFKMWIKWENCFQ